MSDTIGILIVCAVIFTIGFITGFIYVGNYYRKTIAELESSITRTAQGLTRMGIDFTKDDPTKKGK